MLSGPRVVEHIILAALRDAFSLRQPCVPARSRVLRSRHSN
jgi:hypothetical protein